MVRTHNVVRKTCHGTGCRSARKLQHMVTLERFPPKDKGKWDKRGGKKKNLKKSGMWKGPRGTLRGEKRGRRLLIPGDNVLEGGGL